MRISLETEEDKDVRFTGTSSTLRYTTHYLKPKTGVRVNLQETRYLSLDSTKTLTSSLTLRERKQMYSSSTYLLTQTMLSTTGSMPLLTLDTPETTRYSKDNLVV